VRGKGTHCNKSSQTVRDKGTHVNKAPQTVRGKGTHVNKAPQTVRDKETHVNKALQTVRDKVKVNYNLLLDKSSLNFVFPTKTRRNTFWPCIDPLGGTNDHILFDVKFSALSIAIKNGGFHLKF